MKIHGVIVKDGSAMPIEQAFIMELPSDWKKFHADNVAKLDQELVEEAVQFLRGQLAEQMDYIRAEIAKDPQEWWVSHHHFAMMGVRNLLRGAGFGETEFGIENLDDYAVGLVEMAAAQ